MNELNTFSNFSGLKPNNTIFFEHIVKIENILKLWRMRQLTLEVLVISKVIHLLLITKLHNNKIDLMYKIQKNFVWEGKKAKIKHSTLCNGYEKGSLKNADLRIR